MNERSIFIAALEKDSQAKRTAYLDEACARDTALRLRVEELLASHVEAGSFLRKPAPECVVEQLAAPTGDQEAPGIPSASDNGQSLVFLTPSNNPDSLGRLGSYEVQEVIGRGGMGIVLRAFDEKLHRVVAIKVMTAPLAGNEHARRRFVREGRAAAAVRDDHVIGIHGVDETNGLPLLVMEYIVGRSLAQRLEAEGPLPVTDILRIGTQIARGLAAAHEQGLVHRDIKPANILLENGVERVKITDFGLAHAVDDVRTTQPGTVIGTPEYMSPEQARGEKVDHRSDLFSLGCVLYAMCAGRPPFRAESTVAIIRRICEDTPRPLSEINPEIPGWLPDVIDKSMAKEASERFQSAAEVAELLSQYLAHVQQPAVSPEPDAITKPRSLRRRMNANARRWSIAAAVLLLLGAGLSLAETTGVTSVAATVIRIVRGDGTLVVEVDDPNIQVLVDGEELVISGAGPKEIRLRPGQHELQSVKDGKAVDTKLVTITRDGRQVVKVAREVANALAKGASGPKLQSLKIPRRGGGSMDLSPDGTKLAFTNLDQKIVVLDLNSQQERTFEQGWGPKFSPDGQKVAYQYETRAASEIRVLTLESGNIERTGVNGKTLRWLPDGKSILLSAPSAEHYGNRDTSRLIDPEHIDIKSLDIADKKVGPIYSGRAGKANSPIYRRHDVSPDGRYLAVSLEKDANQDLYLIPVAGGEPVRLTTDPGIDKAPCWSPDGHAILFMSNRTFERWDFWAIRLANGRPVGDPYLVRADVGANAWVHSWRESGQLLFTTSKGVGHIYSIGFNSRIGQPSGSPTRLTSAHANGEPAWSPDGSRIAFRTAREEKQFLMLMSADGKQERVVASAKPLGGGPVIWLDNDHLAYGGYGPDSMAEGKNRPGIFSVAVNSGQIKALHLDDAGEALFSLDRSPDGKQISFLRGWHQYQIHTINVETKDIKRLSTSDAGISRPRYSPNGTEIVYTQVTGAGGAEKPYRRSLMAVPVAGGEPREIYGTDSRDQYWDTTSTWLPDGRLTFEVRTTSGQGLWAVPADGSKPPEKITDLGYNFRISPQGTTAVFEKSAFSQDHWIMEDFLPPLDEPKAATAPAAAAAQEKSAGPAARLVWADSQSFQRSGEPTGVPSPDGKYISYTDGATGDVGVYELATGKSRRLTNEGWPAGYSGSPIFSPDSRQLAYTYFGKEGPEMRVIGIDGAGGRVLYPNQGKEAQSVRPNDWSVDGKYILATLANRNAGQNGIQIVLVSAADGSVRVLKTFDRDEPGLTGRMSLSPDGRFAAYSARPAKTSSNRDIFLLATDGSGEVPLVANSADDHVLGWAPDGKRLVFASDRTGSMGIWMIAVADGKPQGAAELLKPHMEGIYTMGFSRGGSFYYALVCRGQNVYTATLDLEKGELLTPPAEAMQRVEGHNWSPAWSPDGRYLACLLTRGPESRFYIRSMDTNEVRELAPNVREFGASKFNNRNSFFWNGDCLNWSPDGRALLCAGAGAEETGGTRVMSIDVQTGEVTRIGASQISYAPMSAPDGNALFYVRGGTFVRLNRGSDVEQELFRRAEQRGDVATRFTTLSPDGRLVAYAKGGALKVLPATGGATRELVTGEGYITAVAWMPDGQHLLFQRSGTAGLQLWRIPAIGGEPRKLDVDLPAMVHLRVHPDGRQIAFGAQVKEGRKNEIWALENFIPPLANPPAPAAEADSAAKSD